jgi:hypothetical protein
MNLDYSDLRNLLLSLSFHVIARSPGGTTKQSVKILLNLKGLLCFVPRNRYYVAPRNDVLIKT